MTSILLVELVPALQTWFDTILGIPKTAAQNQGQGDGQSLSLVDAPGPNDGQISKFNEHCGILYRLAYRIGLAAPYKDDGCSSSHSVLSFLLRVTSPLKRSPLSQR